MIRPSVDDEAEPEKPTRTTVSTLPAAVVPLLSHCKMESAPVVPVVNIPVLATKVPRIKEKSPTVPAVRIVVVPMVLT